VFLVLDRVELKMDDNLNKQTQPIKVVYVATMFKLSINQFYHIE